MSAIDLVLFQNNIPGELRSIIMQYLVEPLTDNNIHHAAKLWMTNTEDAIRRYGMISEWRTSRVTNMSYLFTNDTPSKYIISLNEFNENIEDWDVSNVVTMQGMFQGCAKFNKPLTRWNTSKVTNMSYMFRHCHTFNQPLHHWDTSSVITMNGTFSYAHSFNQSLQHLYVGEVREMNSLFDGAYSFNQPLNAWNVSKVDDMSNMFRFAYSFNQPLNNWDVQKVKSMSSMFEEAIAFNQPLDFWNVSSCIEMYSMFKKAIAYKQPLNHWEYDTMVAKPNTFDMFSRAISFDAQTNATWYHTEDDHNVNEAITCHQNAYISFVNYISATIYLIIKWIESKHAYYHVKLLAWDKQSGFYLQNNHISLLMMCQVCCHWLVIGLGILMWWWRASMSDSTSTVVYRVWLICGIISNAVYYLREPL